MMNTIRRILEMLLLCGGFATANEPTPISNFLNKAYATLSPILKSSMEGKIQDFDIREIQLKLDFSHLDYGTLTLGQESQLISHFVSSDTIEASVAAAAVNRCNREFRSRFSTSVKAFLVKYPQHNTERKIGTIGDTGVTFEQTKPSEQIESILASL